MKFLVIAFLISHTTISSLAVADDLPSPQEIEDHIRAWRADFVVLRMGYDQTWPGASEVRCYRELTITDTKDYYDFDEWHEPDKVPRREVVGGNAQGRFRAGYRLNSETNEWVLSGVNRLSRGNDNIGSSMIVHPLWPMMQPFGHWLDEYSIKDHLTVDGLKVLDGEECVVVTFTHPMFNGSNSFEAWLVTQKDYLPRRAVPSAGNERGNIFYNCDEFQHDGVRWYPYKGRLGTEKNDSYAMNWEVTKFEVNPKLSASLFTPPDDSHIRKKRQAEARRNKEQRQPKQQGEPLPEAIAPSWGNSAWIIALLSGVILLTIGYFRFIRFRSL